MDDPRSTSVAPSGEPAGFFRTDHLKADLKARTVRGGAVTMLAQGARFTLNMGSTIVLARLLAPADYGLVGMVTAVTGFLAIFKDMGLSWATIQREEITHEQVSTLFWLNVLLSLAIGLLTLALAPLLAWFYHEPRLLGITLALAAGFLAGGLAMQHQALLKRQMRYEALTAIDLASMGAGLAVAIALAAGGFKYWALVWMTLASTATMTLLSWTLCRWRPGRPVRGAGVRAMAMFGGHMTGCTIINYFTRNLDNLLIGRRWGAGELGLYSRAYLLLTQPLSQINMPLGAVVIPGLSRLQGDPPAFRAFYLKALAVLTFLTFPLVGFLALCSRETIGLVLGARWAGASVIFTNLAPAALLIPVLDSCGWLFIAMGRADRLFKAGIWGSLAMVASFAIGLPWGAKGVALAYSAANLLWFFPFLYCGTRITAIRLADIFGVIQWPFYAAGLSGGAAWLVRPLLAGFPPAAVLAACFAVMAPLYLALMFLAFGKYAEFRSILQTLKSARKAGAHG